MRPDFSSCSHSSGKDRRYRYSVYSDAARKCHKATGLAASRVPREQVQREPRCWFGGCTSVASNRRWISNGQLRGTASVCRPGQEGRTDRQKATRTRRETVRSNSNRFRDGPGELGQRLRRFKEDCVDLSGVLCCCGRSWGASGRRGRDLLGRNAQLEENGRAS